jgi:hypothetical protein
LETLRAKRAALLAPQAELAELDAQIAALSAARQAEAAGQAEASRLARVAEARNGATEAVKRVVDLATALAAAMVDLDGRERELKKLRAPGAALSRGDLPAALARCLRDWRRTQPELFGLPPKPTMRERILAELRGKAAGLARDIAAMEGEQGGDWEMHTLATARAALSDVRKELAGMEAA